MGWLGWGLAASDEVMPLGAKANGLVAPTSLVHGAEVLISSVACQESLRFSAEPAARSCI